jgi:hypothetical protein
VIEHVDPWAITIAVVCAPLATVAISGMLDVFGHRSHRADLRQRYGDAHRSINASPNQEAISQSKIPASPPLISDNQS